MSFKSSIFWNQKNPIQFDFSSTEIQSAPHTIYIILLTHYQIQDLS